MSPGPGRDRPGSAGGARSGRCRRARSSDPGGGCLPAGGRRRGGRGGSAHGRRSGQPGDGARREVGDRPRGAHGHVGSGVARRPLLVVRRVPRAHRPDQRSRFRARLAGAGPGAGRSRLGRRTSRQQPGRSGSAGACRGRPARRGADGARTTRPDVPARAGLAGVGGDSPVDPRGRAGRAARRPDSRACPCGRRRRRDAAGGDRRLPSDRAHPSARGVRHEPDPGRGLRAHCGPLVRRSRSLATPGRGRWASRPSS